jgi:hypothetical protein
MRHAWSIAAGTLGGSLLGVGARAWMRFISDDPEFTLSGTLFIVLGFTIFGLTQSIGRITIASTRRWVPTIGRAVGVVGMLPLFAAAGGIMMPTVVAGGFAVRDGVPRWVRVVCVAIAMVPLLMVANIVLTSDLGWSLRSLVGILLAAVLYSLVILIARPTFASRLDGHRVPRNAIIVTFAALGLLFAGLAVGTSG